VLRRSRRKQPQRVDGRSILAGNEDVAGYADQRLPVRPCGQIPSIGIRLVDDLAINRHDNELIGTLDRPRRLAPQPKVGPLTLISIRELLPEEAVVVIDAVSVAGKLKRCKRVEEACSETAESAVAKRGIGLGFDGKIQIPVKAFQCVLADIVQIKIAQ